jgi:small ligand-binding sensory domain FIST
MPFAASLSTVADTEQAVDEVCRQMLAALTGRVDLALVFFSPHHLPSVETIAGGLGEKLQACCVLGCMGESIVGGNREVEHKPAISLWAVQWARPVEMGTFHLELEQTPDGYSLMGWPDELVAADPASSAMIVLGDPTTFPTDLFLNQVNENHAGLRAVGGMASGIRHEGECRLILNGEVRESGAVGILLQGQFGLRSIVSQGCRPIGRPMVITKAEENLILELGGKPPMAQLQ